MDWEIELLESPCYDEKNFMEMYDREKKMTKFLQELTEFVFLEDEPQPADVIFVPGSEEGALAETAAKLYREGYAPWVVPSGKYAKWIGKCVVDGFETEADYFAQIMLENGVPESAILKEREATYTYENAIYTRRLLDEKGIVVEKALLCCQAYHARRCKLYYEILFPEAEIYVCPTVTKKISKEHWFRDPEHIGIVLGEIERCGSQFHRIVQEYGALEK